MRNIILLVLFFITAAISGWVVTFAVTNHATVDLSKFKVTPEKINEDIQGRYVIVPPGQAWGFTNEQKLNIKILQNKTAEDGVFVYVDLSAQALLMQLGKEKEKPSSTMIYLNGVAKLYYEIIGGEWYLAEITSINLRATQK